jgi:4-hydroxy-2-oxoglutarate aldolase
VCYPLEKHDEWEKRPLLNRTSAHDLSGVFAPVVTPFEADELRLDWLSSNLERLGTTDLKGYLALGSNGEFMSLSDSEQLDILRVFLEKRGDKIVMAGTGRESTRATIAFSCRAAEMGADYVSVLTPHYFPKLMTDRVFVSYYREVADKVPVPVLIYNAPGFASGVQISPAAVKELSRHPNIAGMKDSSSAGMSSYLEATADRAGFHVLAGSANFFYTALACGAAGGVLSLANCLPELCCRLRAEYLAGNAAQARELHLQLIRLNRAVSGRGGVAAVKAAMDLLGYRGGAPRAPLAALESDAVQALRDALQREGVLP